LATFVWMYCCDKAGLEQFPLCDDGVEGDGFGSQKAHLFKEGVGIDCQILCSTTLAK
jgi:hypothetical protein